MGEAKQKADAAERAAFSRQEMIKFFSGMALVGLSQRFGPQDNARDIAGTALELGVETADRVLGFLG